MPFVRSGEYAEGTYIYYICIICVKTNKCSFFYFVSKLRGMLY